MQRAAKMDKSLINKMDPHSRDEREAIVKDKTERFCTEIKK